MALEVSKLCALVSLIVDLESLCVTGFDVVDGGDPVIFQFSNWTVRLSFVVTKPPSCTELSFMLLEVSEL